MNACPLQPELPPGRGHRVSWGRLRGCGKALAIAAAAQRHAGLFLAVTADQADAHRLLEELRFFLSSGPEPELLSFPDWETLPYDQLSPYQDIISGRLATLARLRDATGGILVVSAATLMHRLLPMEYLLSHSLLLRTGQTLDLEAFRQKLVDVGYRVVAQVMEHGDAAVRGSILDIYPMGGDAPFRLDLLDDEIDSIRTFDAETQRSLEKTSEVRVLPAREVPLTPAAVDDFQAAWRLRFDGDPARCPVYRDAGAGIAAAGAEYYLPLFYANTNSLVDYLPENALVIMDEKAPAAAQEFMEMAESRYQQRSGDASWPLLSPDELFYRPRELMEQLQTLPLARTGTTALEAPQDGDVNFATAPPPKLPINPRAQDPLSLLRGFRDGFAGRVLLVAESPGRRETIMELFRAEKVKPAPCRDWNEFLEKNIAFGLTVAPLERGVIVESAGIAILGESLLFGERAQQQRLRQRRQVSADALISSLTELSLDAPVVHEQHGVGRYRGLETLTVNGMESEFICIEYDQGDKLYVPVAALDMVTRFVGMDADHAPLHRLGGGQWRQARRKAQAEAHDVAVELLALHARRTARHGREFTVDNNAYQSFAMAFPFEETPGQADAIAAVLDDMRAAAPMDRLICGDSGFGKTEVAMRAAFVAVDNNRQTALLAPTTLLAQQHYHNFKDRFADWPVRLEMLSRFVPGKEQAATAKALADGRVDIVIGTHKLLQGDLQFRNLGLVIIDEEHRFGVRQKEKLKAIRAEVDVLTMTATPIPRTLNLALSELRSLSIIATPPARRLPVKLLVREWGDAWIREALLREIKRGGQAYFLHNDIGSMERMAAAVAALAPEARVRIAHGQMPEKLLEQVMLDFYHLRFNVLLCTTIIETGIDVPSANTIIINRADKFGLAQLYQLRGRVGRSHHRAYAYLVTPDRRSVSAAARRRLEALEGLEELGTGFTLAAHDMEIRGVGEILGAEQSGRIQEIGYGMYMDLLRRAVASLKAGQQAGMEEFPDHGIEVNLHVPALIPSDYLPDAHTRLLMYKRIAGADQAAALRDVQEEFIDRFGLLPPPLKNLFRIAGVKLRARALGIRRITLGEQGGNLGFHEHTPLPPEKIIALLQAKPGVYRMDGSDTLRIRHGIADVEERFCFLEALLAQLAPAPAHPDPVRTGARDNAVMTT